MYKEQHDSLAVCVHETIAFIFGGNSNKIERFFFEYKLLDPSNEFEFHEHRYHHSMVIMETIFG